MIVLKALLPLAESWSRVSQLRKIRYLAYMSFSCFSMFMLLFIYYTCSRIRTATEAKNHVVVFASVLSQNLQPIRYLAQRSDVNILMIIVWAHTFPGLSNTTYQAIVDFVDALKSQGYSNDNIIVAQAGAPKEDTPSSLRTLHDTARKASVAVANNVFGKLDELLASYEADFLVLGPCTDVANFLQNYPDHRHRIRRITIGGSAFTVPGNAQYIYPQSNSKSELNFYLDAEAADFVMQGSHGRPVTLLSLDASFAWPAAQYNSLVTYPARSSSGSVDRTAWIVANGLMYYYTSILSYPEDARLVAVEMLAACYMIDTAVQDYSRIMNTHVGVHRDKTLSDYGQSYHSSSNPFNFTVMVVMGIDEAAFWGTVENAYTLPLS